MSYFKAFRFFQFSQKCGTSLFFHIITPALAASSLLYILQVSAQATPSDLFALLRQLRNTNTDLFTFN